MEFATDKSHTEEVTRYWQDYLATLLPGSSDNREPTVDQFGDHPQLADELAQLILAGIKTATCSALWEWEAEDCALPEVGLKTIVLDSSNQPLCVIETIDVSLCAFNEVDAQFAYEEGEDDRSLAAWQAEHWKYFSRVLPLIGKLPTPEMQLVCERFRVVYQ